MGVYKNMIGTIKQPCLILVDTLLLHSLPKEQVLSGMGEAVKYAVAHDYAFFCYLQSASLANLDYEEIVKVCSKIKMKMVEYDPNDAGDVRISLNFGHTLGHAVERLANLPHGFAVAVGMVFAIKASVALGLLHQKEAAEITALIQKFKLPTKVSGVLQNDVLTLMKKDKKVIGGKLRFVLLTGVGKTTVRTIDEKTVLALLPQVIL